MSNGHYARNSPTKMTVRTVERTNAMTTKITVGFKPDTPCREWGRLNVWGYPVRQGEPMRRLGTHLVHRQVMILAGHDITDKVVMHRCDNPACFRYDHLAVGTHAENMADMRAKGRGWTKLTEEQVAQIRSRYKGPQNPGPGANTGPTQRELASEFDVSQVSIGRIIRGEIWSAQ